MAGRYVNRPVGKRGRRKGFFMSEKTNQKSLLDRILDGIERVGNKLPDPITLFLGLAVIVTLVSWLCSSLGVAVVNPANGETVTVTNLFSVYGIQYHEHTGGKRTICLPQDAQAGRARALLGALLCLPTPATCVVLGAYRWCWCER